MKKSFRPQTITDQTITDQTISDSAAATYRAVNQSPECILPEPTLRANREPAVINNDVSSAHLAQMQAVLCELANVKTELSAIKHARSREAQIALAQNKQLERRLQHFVQNLVKRTMHDAIQRFVRLRGSAVPEPARQPSTYIVPQR